MGEQATGARQADEYKCSRLIVKGLPKYSTEEDLRRLFQQYGVITDCQLKYAADGRFRCFGFVGFLTEDSAEDALKALNNTFVGIYRIQIKYCLRYCPPSDAENAGKMAKQLSVGSSGAVVRIECSKPMKRKQVLVFLAPTKPARFQLSADGLVATVRLRRKADLAAVSKLDNAFMGGSRVRVVSSEAGDKLKEENQSGEPKTRPQYPTVDVQKEADRIADTGALFVRNLAYQCSEADLRNLFGTFGPIAELEYCSDAQGKPKGYARVKFVFPEHALQAYTECDGLIFQGRLLHIIASIEPDRPEQKNQQEEEEEKNESTVPYKETKKLKEKELQQAVRTWNTLFLGASAVADVMSDQLQVRKSEILDPTSSSSLGVRMALGEAQIIRETKEFLEQHGVVLDSFQGLPVSRSERVILVKNLPAKTKPVHIRRVFEEHGRLGRLVLPPHGLSALVEFLDVREARKAFEELAFRRFRSKPLFLEWAPANVFSSGYEAAATTTVVEEEKQKEPVVVDQSEGRSVFVKNLSAITTEQGLIEHFKKLGPVSSASIIKKYTKGDGKDRAKLHSMCYGFVTFQNSKDAMEAVKRMQGRKLDGQEIELKMAPPKDKPMENATGEHWKRSKSGAGGSETKILVRNVPFQATVKELKQIFKVFGTLRSVRMPKKTASEQHRGFAFVEFDSKSDGERAMEALGASTHLYGRRLVLEWADADADLQQLRNRTAEYFAGAGGWSSSSKKVKLDVE